MSTVPPATVPATAGHGRIVRPYMLTGGRTRSKGVDLPIETLARTTKEGTAHLGWLVREQAAIARLCADYQSLAEISAHLHIPLGVSRVLVGDMVHDGWLSVSTGVGGLTGDDLPDLSLLERVLDGLRSV